eukprot:CAMPEP_0176473870 /NCGR_PEP_ID=MMETSP0127-20121128/42594_1 /TAXON_ID=938130 /ORGANISM="Platyophrya macrostoma, Strain WH" /LENGTH=54 /DNA_ID=CAMNT_0017869009 /DNA_START=23 /DNA_END=183 /DNA_ORIENTATION=+
MAEKRQEALKRQGQDNRRLLYGHHEQVKKVVDFLGGSVSEESVIQALNQTKGDA